MTKSFRGVSYYPGLQGKGDSAPCVKLTLFTISNEWDTIPNVSVIGPNGTIYLSVEFYALCPVLSGVIQSFSFQLIPHTTLYKLTFLTKSTASLTRRQSYNSNSLSTEIEVEVEPHVEPVVESEVGFKVTRRVKSQVELKVESDVKLEVDSEVKLEVEAEVQLKVKSEAQSQFETADLQE